jgi:hypothetical protein
MEPCTFQPQIPKDTSFVFTKPTFDRLSDTTPVKLKLEKNEEVRKRREARE